MKKMIFAIAMSVGFAAGASAQTTWQMNSNGSGFGWDSRGNSFQGHSDKQGNSYMYDNRGNSRNCQKVGAFTHCN